MSGSRGQTYRFGPFLLNPAEHTLARDGKAVPLTPKAFETLVILAENRGHMITKEELMNRLWPDSFVEENNLSQNISLLRKALGDDAKEYIETVPKRGYRFVAAVEAEAPARAPETRYAMSGDVNIAYQVLGAGPVDMVFVMGWVSHVEYFWKEPSFARFLNRLASFSRLILFDKRGTGLSDRVPLNELPTLEQRMDDVRAVMEAAGSERAVIFGVSEGGPMSALFAATHPAMTLALVMVGSYARRVRDVDYPWGPTEDERQQFLNEIIHRWGGPIGIETRAPSMAADPAFREWWATYLRMGSSPGAAAALTRMNAQIDVRHVLPSVRVPALVIHREGDMCLRVEEGRYMASRIPGARMVVLPGADHLPFVGDQDAILDEIERFLATLRPEPVERVLATVLSVQAGAAQARFDEYCAREIERFGGRKIGGLAGPLATFDGPARAIRCACALVRAAEREGLRLAAGLHTGECDRLEGARVAGLAVDIATQVSLRAAPGEVVVSRTVRDLVAGSGLRFQEAGVLVLRHDLGDLPLFQVAS